MNPKLMFVVCIILTLIIYYFSLHLFPLGSDADIFQTSSSGRKSITLTPRHVQVFFSGIISFFLVIFLKILLTALKR